MELDEILKPEAVIASLHATSKKHLLQELSKSAAHVFGLDSRQVFDILLERERLGSTGVGSGLAIPHGKLPQLDRLHGLFARLDKPVDFDAIDDQPVDLVFLLLAPEGAGADHLKALARISRILRDHTFCEKLRGSENPDALFALLMEAGNTGLDQFRAAS
ncbi:MAG: PTS IIA-like nitrogen regulatory protein PtsN [Alphaproteobacteria bacterium]